MSNTSKTKTNTRTVAIGAALTAIVIVLQLLGSFIHLGPFSVSLVLVPIVIGAATCGVGIATWLGFVFAVTVLLSGDAAAFMGINIFGTIVTVVLKGMACGFAAGLVFKALQKVNFLVAVLAASVICPIVNTGVFLWGCWVFFLEEIASWGAAGGFTNVAAYMFLGLAGGNFIFELITNLVLSPAVSTILKLTIKKV